MEFDASNMFQTSSDTDMFPTVFQHLFFVVVVWEVRRASALALRVIFFSYLCVI